MEEDDEEFELLLGEIPRATSAPPHLEELHRGDGSLKGDSLFESGHLDASKSMADMPFCKKYQGSYASYSGNKNPSTPILEDNILSLHIPTTAINQLSSLYRGLTLGSPGSELQQIGFLEMQQRLQSQEEGQQGHEIPHQQCDSLHSDLVGNPVLSSRSCALSVFNLKSNSQSIFSNGFGKTYGDQRITDGFANHQPTNGSSEGGKHISGITNLYTRLNASASSSGYVVSQPESLQYSPSKSSTMLSLQGVDSGLQNLPSGLPVLALGKGSLSLDPFTPGKNSEEDHHATSSPYQQKLLHQLYGFSLTEGQTQSAQRIQNSPYHLSRQFSSLQHQLRQDLGFSNFQAHKHFHQAELLRQAQHLQIIQHIREAAALKEQQFCIQHQVQQQDDQLHARFMVPNQATLEGVLSERVPLNQALPFSVGINTQQQALLHRSQLGGSIQEAGWIAQESREETLSTLTNATLPDLGNTCRFFSQGYCSRGTGCHFSHSSLPAGISMTSSKDSRISVSPAEEKTILHGDLHLLRRSSRSTLTTVGIASSGYGIRKKGLGGVQSKPSGYANGGQLPRSFSTILPDDISELQPQRLSMSQSPYLQQQFKYASLQEVEGRILAIAKDQHGCRFLQRKFDEGDPEEMEKIFVEVIDHIIELMTDPFGNYLVQKLLEVCNEVQHLQILHNVTVKSELVEISLNMHGTRAVQKLIETLKSPDQIKMVISSLQNGVVTLIKDLNGNHVIQRCLQRLTNEDNEFIFDAAATNCVDIATHRHGCCVLQRCVDFASGDQHQRLVAEIAANSLQLSQDQYGNYVVQYVLDLAIPWAMDEVMVRLEGNYALLSMQKFSSNVVEKCLKLAGDENRTRIVNELMSSSVLGQLLQDPFANYVVQRALTVTKGSLHSILVEAIRPHLPTLRTSPYGKRILSRTNLKR